MKRHMFEMVDETGESGEKVFSILKETVQFELDNLHDMLLFDPQEALRINAENRVTILKNVLNMKYVGFSEKY